MRVFQTVQPRVIRWGEGGGGEGESVCTNHNGLVGEDGDI